MTTEFSFYDGPWENATDPTIVRDDPEGGDPLILATLARVHRPEDLHELCRLANANAVPPSQSVEVVEALREARSMLRACGIEDPDGEGADIKASWDRGLARIDAVISKLESSHG